MAIAAFVLVSSPFGCHGGPEFEFGEQEMRTAALGRWHLTFAAGQRRVTLELEQARGTSTAHSPLALVRAAHACGSRTFVRSASACADVSVLPVVGSAIAAGDPIDGQAVRGSLTVYGTRFSTGRLEAQVGEALTIDASITPTGHAAGQVASIRIEGHDGEVGALLRPGQ